jgi:bifunctional non-homologous end joining protein LigD
MLAVPGTIDEVTGAGWAYEMKWDGVRLIAYARDGGVRLLSRNDRDVTATYPELHGLAGAVDGVVLDGEVVALDQKGRPSFGRLQQRMGLTKAAQVEAARSEVPVAYLVFDVLFHDGHATTSLPYFERRATLEALGLSGEEWAVPPVTFDGAADMLATSLERGLEGVIAKRVDSPYFPGRRSPTWRKVKNFRTQEVVIVGWRPGNGRRADGIGSLLVGVYDDENKLRYAGRVGTGFTERALADLGTRFRSMTRATTPLDIPPPRADARDAHWITPNLVGEVVFTEWTSDGRLRHPAWRGLRPDKGPTDVHVE